MLQCSLELSLLFQFLIGRLDTPKKTIGSVGYHRFQFLIGRLDTEMFLVPTKELIGFQFLIGRLDTSKFSREEILKIGFNSS